MNDIEDRCGERCSRDWVERIRCLWRFSGWRASNVSSDTQLAKGHVKVHDILATLSKSVNLMARVCV